MRKQRLKTHVKSWKEKADWEKGPSEQGRRLCKTQQVQEHRGSTYYMNIFGIFVWCCGSNSAPYRVKAIAQPLNPTPTPLTINNSFLGYEYALFFIFYNLVASGGIANDMLVSPNPPEFRRLEREGDMFVHLTVSLFSFGGLLARNHLRASK